MTLKIDPMRHRKPGFIGLSWKAHRVFDMLLGVSYAERFNGTIPAAYWFPSFLATTFDVKSSDVGVADVTTWIYNGIAELIGAGIVEKLAGDNASIVIPQWEDYIDSGKKAKPKKMRLSNESPETNKLAVGWNAMAELVSLPFVLRLNDERIAKANAVLNSWSADSINKALAKVKASDFLIGKNDRKWMADFDWFIRPGTIARILEGKYDNKGQADVKIVTPTKDLYA